MDIISGLTSPNSSEAYALLLRLEEKSAQSDELYTYFGDFLELLSHKSSLVRTRGFRLICAQAKWDSGNLIEANLPALLSLFGDGKATVIRQCLSALHGVLLYKPELSVAISEKLDSMDLSKYKESMSTLIMRDINELRKIMD
ncbi:MAG: hypothetical protein ACI4WS_14870 [Oscillospiraceae bacterium]